MARDVRNDGSVTQDGHRFRERPEYPGEAASKMSGFVFGRVVAVYYADDAEHNPKGETVLCDVYVRRLGQTLPKVQVLLEKGGIDNYIYYSPQPSTANVDGSPFDLLTHDSAVANGDTVKIEFELDDYHSPYITKVMAHNQSGYAPIAGNSLSPDPRPGKDDGDCYKVRFNGTNFLIDKEGNVSFSNTLTLGELTSGEVIPHSRTFTVDFTDAAGQNSTLVFDSETGNFTFTGSNGTTFTIDNENDKIDLLTNFGDELSVSAADGIQATTPASGGTTLSMKNGEIDITAAQAISVTCSGGDVSVESDGGDVSVKSTTGDVNVESTTGAVAIQSSGDATVLSLTGDVKVTSMTGNATVSGAGGSEVNLTAGQVAIGVKTVPTAEHGAVIMQMLEWWATAVFAGFGAPASVAPAAATLLTTFSPTVGTL